MIDHFRDLIHFFLFLLILIRRALIATNPLKMKHLNLVSYSWPPSLVLEAGLRFPTRLVATGGVTGPAPPHTRGQRCPQVLPPQHQRWGLQKSPRLVLLGQCGSALLVISADREGKGNVWVLREAAQALQGARISVTRKLLSPPCHSAPGELAPKRVCVGDLIYCLSIRAESHWTHRQNMTSRSGKQ